MRLVRVDRPSCRSSYVVFLCPCSLRLGFGPSVSCLFSRVFLRLVCVLLEPQFFFVVPSVRLHAPLVCFFFFSFFFSHPPTLATPTTRPLRACFAVLKFQPGPVVVFIPLVTLRDCLIASYTHRLNNPQLACSLSECPHQPITSHHHHALFSSFMPRRSRAHPIAPTSNPLISSSSSSSSTKLLLPRIAFNGLSSPRSSHSSPRSSHSNS